MWKSGSRRRPSPSTVAPVRHLAQGAGRPGPGCATMWTMSSAATAADLAEHVERLDRDGYTIVRDAFSPLLAEQLSRRHRPPRGRAQGQAGGQRLRGSPHHPRLQPAGAQHRLRADPGAPGGPPARQAPARRRLPGEQPVVDHDRARRDGPADPRRRPGDPDRQAAPGVHGQQHVGADRLHRGQRRNAARSPARTSPTTPPPTASTTTASRRRWPSGSILVWHGSLWHGGGANTHHHPAPRHRHELLRRLGPPAGEPAARGAQGAGQDASRPSCRSCAGSASTAG